MTSRATCRSTSTAPATSACSGNIGEPERASGWLVDVDLDCEEAVAPPVVPAADGRDVRAAGQARVALVVRVRGGKTRKAPGPGVEEDDRRAAEHRGRRSSARASIPAGSRTTRSTANPPWSTPGNWPPLSRAGRGRDRGPARRRGTPTIVVHSRAGKRRRFPGGRRRAAARCGVPRPHPAGDLRLRRAQPDVARPRRRWCTASASTRGGVLAAVGSVQPAVRAAVVGEGTAARGDRRRQQAARPAARAGCGPSELRTSAEWICRPSWRGSRRWRIRPDAAAAGRSWPASCPRRSPSRVHPGGDGLQPRHRPTRARRWRLRARWRCRPFLAGRKVRDPGGNRTNIPARLAARPPARTGPQDQRPRAPGRSASARGWATSLDAGEGRAGRAPRHARDPLPDRRVRRAAAPSTREAPHLFNVDHGHAADDVLGLQLGLPAAQRRRRASRASINQPCLVLFGNRDPEPLLRVAHADSQERRFNGLASHRMFESLESGPRGSGPRKPTSAIARSAPGGGSDLRPGGNSPTTIQAEGRSAHRRSPGAVRASPRQPRTGRRGQGARRGRDDGAEASEQTRCSMPTPARRTTRSR